MSEIENQFSKNKNEALDMVKTFVNKIENQFSIKIKRFHNDRGSEYNSSLFNKFSKQHETNASYSPKINDKKETKNKIVIEFVITIMFNSGIRTH